MTFLPESPHYPDYLQTALLRLLTNTDDPAKLQEDLSKLETWENEWDIAFHPDKCSQLSLTRSRKLVNANTKYSLHGHTLERVSSVKYLGVTLLNLYWGVHVDNVCARANRMLGFLRRHMKVCSTKTKELAYKATVRPIMEYACTVWDPHTDKLTNKLEKT
ncbi:uncharacterized protein LOC143294162 [Babylonia areolata]|uniref:uncharacterized protein LOC143294162 n=1 Tax=Babylonia areolata TaxID=304850 RepID=UPI003FCF1BEA